MKKIILSAFAILIAKFFICNEYLYSFDKVWSIKANDNPIHEIIITKDKKNIYYISSRYLDWFGLPYYTYFQKNLKYLDLDSGILIKELIFSNEIASIDLFKNENYLLIGLFVGGFEPINNKIWIYDFKKDSIIKQFNPNIFLQCSKLYNNENNYLTSSYGTYSGGSIGFTRGDIRIFNTNTGILDSIIYEDTGFDHIVISNNNLFFGVKGLEYYTSTGNTYMRIFFKLFNSDYDIIYENDNVHSFNFFDSTIVLGFSNGKLAIQNLYNSQMIIEKNILSNVINSISISEDGKYILASDFIGDLILVHTKTLKILEQIKFPQDSAINIVQFVNDSTHFLTGNKKAELTKWKTKYLSNKLKSLFIADKNVCNISDIINFYDLSTGNPNNWIWDFGDGNYSYEQNPTHSYKDTGTYTVSLIVSKGTLNDTIIEKNYIKINEPSNVSEKDIDINISVKPNPFQDFTNLQYHVSEPSNIRIEVFNSIGNLLYNFEEYCNETGDFSKYLNFSGKSNGIYFIRFIVNNQTSKIISILNN